MILKRCTKMKFIILPAFIVICFELAKGISLNDRLNFINDFISSNEKPASIISYLKLIPSEKVKYTRDFSKKHRFAAFPNHYEDGIYNTYLADLNEEFTIKTLRQAADINILKSPARWILFFTITSFKQNGKVGNKTSKHMNINNDKNKVIDEDIRKSIDAKLSSVYTAINTEIYIALEGEYDIYLYLVYKIREHMSLIWKEYGIWNQQRSFDRAPPNTALAMRRRNLQRLNMVAATVIIDKRTLSDMPHYRNSHVDSISKFTYYMTIHLFDWLNVTGTINITSSYGYIQADGLFDGVVKELAEGRSDFCAGVLFPLENRKKFVHFVTSPAKVDVSFIFKKPPLATIANIYSLPFSKGVWISIVVLIFISALALGFTTLWEMIISEDQKLKMTITQRISQNFHDTLSLVFQQGISNEFYSSSARQVLLLGLMSFMFLYTAYSANVVALLQSATNEINSVATLLNSPLQCGTDDTDNRSLYRALWLKKAAPQGEGFFLSAEEGIRRVRQGLYAFHVEIPIAYYHIQKTYLEHEKCNLAEIKYFTFSDPHICTSITSPSKEQIRIGIMRIVETGLQSRSNRRLVATRPNCAGTAMFTPVSILFVTPIFKYLLLIYGTSFIILALEIYTHRRGKRAEKTEILQSDYGDN